MKSIGFLQESWQAALQHAGERRRRRAGSRDSRDSQAPRVPPGRLGGREEPAEEQRHSETNL